LLTSITSGLLFFFEQLQCREYTLTAFLAIAKLQINYQWFFKNEKRSLAAYRIKEVFRGTPLAQHF
jgi:hypothetical protein